jgi:hypothetical protein
MLRKTKDLIGCRLGAQDGEIGHLKDLYFDDLAWTVRYLIADTGNWLPGRKVLVSASAVRTIRFASHKVIDVDLTRQQIEQGPSIDAHRPVSRQYEAQCAKHFGWPYYWAGPLLWGPVAIPGECFAPTPPGFHPVEPSAEDKDSHLQSTEELAGYSIQALDQHFGHIEQFIVDDQDWAIRYLVADLRNWWPGRKVLLAPEWIASVSFPDSMVNIDVDRATVQRSPEYNSSLPISREYEARLFEHYQQKPYWERKPEAHLTH